jgi:hypothetical protein
MELPDPVAQAPQPVPQQSHFRPLHHGAVNEDNGGAGNPGTPGGIEGGKAGHGARYLKGLPSASRLTRKMRGVKGAHVDISSGL